MKRKAVEGPSARPQKKKKKKKSGTPTETISVYDSVNISTSAKPQTLGDIDVDIDLIIRYESLAENPQKDQVLLDFSDFDSDYSSKTQTEPSLRTISNTYCC